MRVMIIPEDQKLDQYILKPIIEAIFKDLKRVARVRVPPKPRLRSVDQALEPTLLSSIINSYPQEDMFVLLVDRDCDQNRINRIKARELEAENLGKLLIGRLAIEEVEMWALAISQHQLSVPWQEMRKECHPKEAYFNPLIEQLGLQNDVGLGRKQIMRDLTGRHSRLMQLCPEIAELRERIRGKLRQ